MIKEIDSNSVLPFYLSYNRDLLNVFTNTVATPQQAHEIETPNQNAYENSFLTSNWNSLPNYVVLSPSFSSFKHNLSYTL